MKETTYTVVGMTCQGCVRALSRAIDTAAPGLAHDVQLEGGVLTVRGDHSVQTIADAVEAAGFDLAATPEEPSATTER